MRSSKPCLGRLQLLCQFRGFAAALQAFQRLSGFELNELTGNHFALGVVRGYYISAETEAIDRLQSHLRLLAKETS